VVDLELGVLLAQDLAVVWALVGVEEMQWVSEARHFLRC